MDEQPKTQGEVHPIAGVTAQRMAELAGPLGWGDSCRLLRLDEAIAALRSHDFFAALTDAEVEEVAKLAYECRWSAGMVIFREKEEARNFCLLLEGQVALEKEVRLGPHSPARQATVEYLHPGDMMGWSSLVHPYLYTQSAVIIRPTRALCLDGQALRSLMQRFPHVGLVVMDKVAQVIRSRLEHQGSMLLYFLSIISHELRAPLAAVENYLQVMLSGYAGPLNDDQRTMLERSVLRLTETSELITGVLDLARMHPEQIQQGFEPVDLPEVLTEAVEDVQLRMKQRGIRLEQDVPESLPTLVAAHGRLRQVVSNLLSNAVKFSPERSRVQLVVRPQADKVRIEVIDEGVGIPQDELDNIFLAFYRIRDTAATAGLGLGLSIVKRIVDAHHGQVSVTSELNKGSTFTVCLPCTQSTGGTH